MFKIPLKFRWIYKHLTNNELSKDCSFDLCLSDLFSDKKENKFFGFYSKQGLSLAFKRYGMIKKLREFGYEQIEIKFEQREDGSHSLTVFEPPFRKEGIIAEFVGRKTSLNEIFPVLKIEWLCLQNPKTKFSNDKPKLPGQDFPGLGLGRDALSLILLLGIRLKFQALTNTPDHFHNALIYSNTFEFVNPKDSGRLIAMKNFMEENNLDLAQTAWLLEEEKIYQKGNDNTPFKWQPATQILPLRTSLENQFKSKEYISIVEESSQQYSFYLK